MESIFCRRTKCTNNASDKIVASSGIRLCSACANEFCEIMGESKLSRQDMALEFIEFRTNPKTKDPQAAVLMTAREFLLSKAPTFERE